MSTNGRDMLQVVPPRKKRRIALNAIRQTLIDPGPSADRLAEQSLLHDAVRLVLSDLSHERRAVIALTYGFADHGGVNRGSYTIDEIARVLKISRERVAAVRATTLIRLRRQRKAQRLLSPFA